MASAERKPIMGVGVQGAEPPVGVKGRSPPEAESRLAFVPPTEALICLTLCYCSQNP